MSKKFRFTPAHEKFCQHYSQHGNATQAYLYAWPKVKYDSAKAHGHELLHNDAVSNRIEEIKKELSQKYNITKEKMIDELYNLLESCKKEGIDGQGVIKDRSNWNKSIEVLIKLGGLYSPTKIEHSGDIGFNLNLPGMSNDDEQESEDND